MPLITTAAELFREIKGHGLELRDDNGRDDALYRALAKRLNLPPKGIQQELDRGQVSLEEFVGAFFSLVQPFAQMYADVYTAMQRFGARGAAESIRLRFDFGKQLQDSLTFDLNEFREVEEVLRTIKGLISQQFWSDADLQKIFGFYQRLRNKLPEPSFRDYYSPGKPYALPEVSTTARTLAPILEVLRDAFEHIIEARVELEQRQAAGTTLSNLGTATNEANSDDAAILQAANILTDLIPQFRILLGQAQQSGFEEAIGLDKVAQAARYFHDEIESQLQRRQQLADVQVKELLDVLQLPMWRFRWYLYEVWSTFQVLIALQNYDAHLALNGDQIRLEEGRPSIVADIGTAGGARLQLWAQKQTPVDVPGRKGIQPDLRLCEADGSRPEQTILIIEFKQRKKMTRPELEKLLDLYDIGAPQSLGNFFLNYDSMPPAEELGVRRPEKSHLFEFLTPQQPERVADFRRRLVMLLETAGFRPERAVFDVILLDVSGSMSSLYSTTTARADLERLATVYPDVPVYFFDDRLIAPAGLSPWEEIDRHLHGGTNLEAALQELAQRQPRAKRLLLVTDGDYGPCSSLDAYEMTECDPPSLGQIMNG
jgi:hypothetical protein